MGHLLTGISLFTGAGGMDVGFHQAGVLTLFANELDHQAAETYRSNTKYFNGDVMHEGDIVDYLDLLTTYNGADIVYGGPPCQGFSVAGKMDPDDKRSQLIWTFMDVVEKIRPRLFVMENVKALGKLQKWASVRQRLAKRAETLGYGYTFEILCASDYGVPQARERFVMLGIKNAPSTDVAQVFADEMKKQIKKAPTVRETISKLPRFGSEGNCTGSTAAIRLARHPIVRSSPYQGSLLFNGRGRLVNLDAVSKTLPAQMGGNHTPIIDQRLLDDPTDYNWTESYLQKLKRKQSDPDVTDIEIPDTLRRMTVAEAAAVQTFPRDFSFTGPYGSQYRQIGNAVPCDFAFAIAQGAIGTLNSFA